MNARFWLLAAFLVAAPAAADWPQWRGPNRDAKVTGFQVPATWPKELTQKWKVTIGDGVSTPALVGDKLYTYSREGGDEIIRCLTAADGKEIWKDKNPATAPRGPASGFPGPRASPAVADGKIVTLGVTGLLSCYDAATGSKAWSKNDVKVPGFSTSCSPMIVDGVCIVQLGGDSGGSITAFNLATGEEKWKWASDGTKYASPELLTAGDTKAVVAETAGNIVAVNLADGKLLWKTPFKSRYNASTPFVDGQTVIYSGPAKGTTAMAIEKSADGFSAKELWSNSRTAVQFNTPVVKDGFVYGIATGGKLFCIDEKTGTTAWSADLKAAGRYADYGSVVDAGAVLFALNPSGELVVFEPNGKEFKKVANYQVADGSTFAYPVIADKRIFIKDKNDVTLWTIE